MPALSRSEDDTLTATRRAGPSASEPRSVPIRYLSLADTERLDLRMTQVVLVIEEAFRLVGEARAATVPRVLRLLYPPLAAGSTGEGRPWERDMRNG